MNIILLIDKPGPGGAERQAAQLALGLAGQGHQVGLVTLFPGDWPAGRDRIFLGGLIRAKARSTPLTGLQLLGAAVRLGRLLGRRRPDVIYSLLHPSNLLAWLAKQGRGRAKLVWGIRASGGRLNWKQRLPFLACALVSPTVDLLIANSTAGLSHCREHGYRAKKQAVIPNGIDTRLFRPDPRGGRRVRAQWGVEEGHKLVGLVARLHPKKDHPTFLRAAARLARVRPEVRFVCVGGGPGRYRAELQALAVSLGLAGRLTWAGLRTDMPAVYSSLDLLASSSWSEGFSSALGEALACGTPCVATDVGQARLVVGQTGLVVPSRDPEALSRGLERALRGEVAPGVVCRRWIQDNFSLERLIRATEENFRQLVGGR